MPKVIDEHSSSAVLTATSGSSNSWRGPGPPAKLVDSTPYVANSVAKISASLIR